MHHDHWTVAPESRRALPVLAIVVAAVVLTGLLAVLALRDAGGAADAVVVFDPATEVTTTTTAPTTTVAPTPATTAPPPRPPPPPVQAAEDDGGSVEAPRPTEPADALAALARDVGASEVTPVVEKSAGTFAVVTAGGTARLHQWRDDQWIEREVISTPATVREVTAVDVTGDGTADFVIKMGAGSRTGGVFNNAGGRWGWIPFVHDAGSSDFVDGLRVEGGRIRSEIELPTGGHSPAEWRWDGSRFTIR